MKKILFVLDRAHGKNIKGKQSFNGEHIEWEWSDRFIDLLSKDLTYLGVPWKETVPEDIEPGFTKRVKRANKFSKMAEVTIFLSFHNNTGGGKGIKLFTAPESNESEEIAQLIAENLMDCFPECECCRLNKKELHREASFTVVAGNKYIKPTYYGIHIEYLFMDNPIDLKKLSDPYYTIQFKNALLYSIFELCQKYGLNNI